MVVVKGRALLVLVLALALVLTSGWSVLNVVLLVKLRSLTISIWPGLILTN